MSHISHIGIFSNSEALVKGFDECATWDFAYR